MDRQIAFGMTCKGPLDSRPEDAIGLAIGLPIGSNHVNSRVAEGMRLTNGVGGPQRPMAGSESAAEFFYAWTSLPFCSLQPNLRYVRHPGGVSSYEPVVIIGL